MSCARLALAVLVVLAPVAAAQRLAGHHTEAVEQARVRSIVGDLGLPELPPATDGPRTSLVFADRLFDYPPPSDISDSGQQSFTVPPELTGTGKAEIIWYQLPPGYVAGGAPRPMLIAWHGYGSSAFSVANLTTLDEECAARGWIYLSVTGLDDKLFGSVASQQNAAAGIQWMMDNFTVDPDRLYMVGWSMGGGCVTDFAARHRDPAGIMIAALGTVSMTGDWTESYSLAPLAEQQIMENPLCFGGPPSEFPFEYQRCSSLYFTPDSYPPTPGTLDATIAMGDNLDTTPLWMTWDVADPVAENPPVMSADLASLVNSVGGAAETHPVSGTSNPHSWDVLDETALCNWFDGKVVDREPHHFHGQLDLPGPLSFSTVQQTAAGSFSFVQGSSDVPGKTVTLEQVANAQQVTLDAGLAGQAGDWPLHVVVGSADANGFLARLTGFSQPPSYLLDTATGALISGVDSDPATGSLLLTVPPFGTVDAQIVSQNWKGVLTSTPEPATTGSHVQVNIDMPLYTGTNAFLVVSLGEKLISFKGGNVITANALSPDVVFTQELVLTPSGSLPVKAVIPDEPALHGLRVVMQCVTLLPAGTVGAITNLWAMHIQ